jgi:hypothetical protein
MTEPYVVLRDGDDQDDLYPLDADTGDDPPPFPNDSDPDAVVATRRARAERAAEEAFDLLDDPDPGRLVLDAERAPSDLRQPLETRVRRQADTYANQRRRDLREIIVLCAYALADLDD